MTPSPKILILLAVFFAANGAAFEEPQSIRASHPMPIKPLAAGDSVSVSGRERADTWSECIKEAELERSDRDLNFFRKAKTLSGAKTWLVSHSISNEARFCTKILQCETTYKRLYSESSATYPVCQ